MSINISMAFSKLGDEFIRKLPIKENNKYLVEPPSFICTRRMFILVNSPLFYAHLSREEIIELGSSLLTFLQHKSETDLHVDMFFFWEYIYYNLNILEPRGIMYLLNAAEAHSLPALQYFISLCCRMYKVELPYEYRKRLAVKILCEGCGDVRSRLCILRYLGYFSDFTVEERREIFERSSTTIRSGRYGSFILEIIFPEVRTLEDNSQNIVLRLLAQIDLAMADSNPIEIALILYKYISKCRLNTSFLCRVYRELVRVGSINLAHDIVSFLPGIDSKLMRNLVMLCENYGSGTMKEFLSLEMEMYSHPKLTFRIMLAQLFDTNILGKDRGIGGLYVINMSILYFDRELRDELNCELLFRRMEQCKLYDVIPLFRKYFVKLPSYEKFMVENMRRSISSLNSLGGDYCCDLQYALSENTEGPIGEAFFRYFIHYLSIVLSKNPDPLIIYHLLASIFSKEGFSTYITSAQLKEILLLLSVHRSTRLDFEDIMDVFFRSVRSPDVRNKMAEEMLHLLTLGIIEDSARDVTSRLIIQYFNY